MEKRKKVTEFSCYNEEFWGNYDTTVIYGANFEIRLKYCSH